MGGCYWCLLVPDIEVLDTLTKGRATRQHIHHPAVLKKQMNDSQSFQRTILWSILPAAVAKDALAEEKKSFRKKVCETIAALGVSKVQGFKQHLHKAAVV
jgi:hypothetical protein